MYLPEVLIRHRDDFVLFIANEILHFYCTNNAALAQRHVSLKREHGYRGTHAFAL